MAQMEIDTTDWTQEEKNLIEAAAHSLAYAAGHGDTNPNWNEPNLSIPSLSEGQMAAFLSASIIRTKVGDIISASEYTGHEDSGILSPIPIGTVIERKGAPGDGMLACDGSLVSKATYINLYNQIGDGYGISLDDTKFKLPNETDCVIVF